MENVQFYAGQLPAALSLLTSLQHLDLYNNMLMGDIPSEYSALVHLRDLYLGKNPQLNIDRAALHVQLPLCKLRL
jgi:Leucine-rich repeat (LRR) protein